MTLGAEVFLVGGMWISLIMLLAVLLIAANIRDDVRELRKKR